MARLNSEEAALLKAIASNPDDRLPRLVYADWLEERGRDKRALFIRLQFLEQTEEEFHQRPNHRAAAAELLKVHRYEWFKELPKWARKFYEIRSWERVEYSGGFVQHLKMDLSPFLDFGDQLLDRHPITSIDFYHIKPLRKQLAHCKALGRVRHVELSADALGEEGAKALAANRYLHGIRTLNLEGASLGDRGVQELAEAQSLTALESLDLSDNDLTLGGVKFLRQAKFLPGLRRLILLWNPALGAHSSRLREWFGTRIELQ